MLLLLEQLMNNLDFKAAVEEIKTAAKWLRETGSPKVSLHLARLPICVPTSHQMST